MAPADSAAEYTHHGHKHPYHLVDPSIWPAVGATGAGLAFIGARLVHARGLVVVDGRSAASRSPSPWSGGGAT